MPERLNCQAPDFEARFSAFLNVRRDPPANVGADVEKILTDVKEARDQALCDYTARFDGFDPSASGLRVSESEVDAAIKLCADDEIAALKIAAERIRAFHDRQVPSDLDYEDDAGIRLGYRWRPIAAVGMYVPGGMAAYPSSVLMNAIPAKTAGVPRLVMTAPTPGGDLNPLVMAAARLAGVDEIYRVGGAQAIAALAFGTESIAPVDKIVGPGNAYVAEAKRAVFGVVGIDMIAGPSEVLVVADSANDPAWIAADLLAQAEHDEVAQSILITDDAEFADAVEVSVADHLQTLSRATTARTSWENHGCIILVDSLKDAPPLVDRIAPEHLQLAMDDPDALFAAIRNAGSVFLGRYTPEALGDYVAGPNHVLPTNRSARFSSGLGVLDFVKRSTFLGCDANGLGRLGSATTTLARAEGLDAHARSVSIRLNARS
jgi:histidinol dehydrogenase